MVRQALVSQRYFGRSCGQTFTDTFDTLYYRRQVSEEDVRIVLLFACRRQQKSEVLVAKRGLADETVVSIVQTASRKAQMVHNFEVQAVETLWQHSRLETTAARASRVI
jgi:siroheme synthase